MRIRIIVFAILCISLIFKCSLEGKAISTEIKRELGSLTRRIEILESQQEDSQSQKKIDDCYLLLNEMKNELNNIKKESLVSLSECLSKIDSQRLPQYSNELLEILIKYGNNSEGISALHYAIKIGNINAVNLLLEGGADVNSRNYTRHFNFTALGWAAYNNQLEIVKILVNRGADVQLPITNDSISRDAFYWAVKYGGYSLVQFLIQNGANIEADYGMGESTPLHVAAKEGNLNSMLALIDANANVNAVGKSKHGHGHWYDGTPLDYAVCSLNYKDNPDSLEIIKVLIENGSRRFSTSKSSCGVIKSYLECL